MQDTTLIAAQVEASGEMDTGTLGQGEQNESRHEVLKHLGVSQTFTLEGDVGLTVRKFHARQPSKLFRFWSLCSGDQHIRADIGKDAVCGSVSEIILRFLCAESMSFQPSKAYL